MPAGLNEGLDMLAAYARDHAQEIKMPKNDGGPAYPSHVPFGPIHNGKSLRDWFAGHSDIPWHVAKDIALIWNGHEGSVEEVLEVRAKLRLMEADAMLKERERVP